MAESLVTQVSRDDLHGSERNPRLKIEVDSDSSRNVDDSSMNEKGRSSSWGQIFSRQYIPSTPNTFEPVKDKSGREPDTPRSKGRIWAQSPRIKSEETKLRSSSVLQSVSEDTLVTKQNASAKSYHASTHKRESSSTVWHFLRSCFHSEDPLIDLTAKPTKQPYTIESPPESAESESNDYLLPRSPPGKKHCLVLDLDETLVHSSFKPVEDCDFELAIEMDGVVHRVYVRKRPGVDEFLEALHEHYELVIFTASLDPYANPLLDILDPKGYCTSRLFREHCTKKSGIYIKDLSRLGRDLDSTLIIDNSPHSYAFHPKHALPILSWFDDRQDTELIDMIPFLKSLTEIDNVSRVLDANKSWRVQEKSLRKLLSPCNDD